MLAKVKAQVDILTSKVSKMEDKREGEMERTLKQTHSEIVSQLTMYG